MFLLGCRERGIVTKWEELQRKLDSRKTVLSSQRDLMAVYTEMDSCATEMALMKVKSDWSALFYSAVKCSGIILTYVNTC